MKKKNQKILNKTTANINRIANTGDEETNQVFKPSLRVKRPSGPPPDKNRFLGKIVPEK